jgi:hypothetical protein
MHGSAGDSNFMECRLGDIFGDGGGEQHVPVFLSPVQALPVMPGQINTSASSLQRSPAPMTKRGRPER